MATARTNLLFFVIAGTIGEIWSLRGWIPVPWSHQPSTAGCLTLNRWKQRHTHHWLIFQRKNMHHSRVKQSMYIDMIRSVPINTYRLHLVFVMTLGDLCVAKCESMAPCLVQFQLLPRGAATSFQATHERSLCFQS